ncbi:MAG: hypothetical protein Kow0031_16780 [Anaerolineae bacterium]
MSLNNYAKFAWMTLVFNVFVVVWGAFVRATGSGAGCGSHWPMCNGQIIPWEPRIETLIEFSHRITSGLALLLVIALLVWAFRAYPKGHPVRLGAGLSMFFMFTETLVGASLVLFELVAHNTSFTRAVVMGVHLVNTFLLLASITLTAWWASGGAPVQVKGRGWLGWLLIGGFVALLVLAASGGITALGDTLYPAESLAQGIQDEFSPTADLILRLRVYHPLIAVLVGAYFVLVAALYNSKYPNPLTKKLFRVFTGVYVAQLMLGALNVVLLAPVWMQLVHLFVSDLLLIVMVLYLAAAFARPAAAHQAGSEVSPIPAGRELSRQSSG